MLDEVVLSTERASAFVALVGPLLSVRADVSFEMLQALEWTSAEIHSTDVDLFTFFRHRRC